MIGAGRLPILTFMVDREFAMPVLTVTTAQNPLTYSHAPPCHEYRKIPWIMRMSTLMSRPWPRPLSMECCDYDDRREHSRAHLEHPA